MPILDQGRTVGAVRVTQSNAAVSERVRRNVLVVVGVGLAALALGLGLAWVLAGSLARPLRALATLPAASRTVSSTPGPR